ncbi:sugar phosphate nucleotidyltransferase [Pedobacter sp. MC2016-15]|uniref:nucleotidyltransferase family protein n=1 Tax=Pedobacter sp. MC2016-15 TaxID=2994473 RepID=UPI002245FCE7|nr:sugar phosphate nucleotidyltransferase [Pedobacter sp. MC2016-15]MCX2481823.1 sugar phosphate nucleotidyltransferase [Pedobacter sp. MC2016-15]
MKPTLLILAAGMASRYGSMKQMDGFGPNQETIIDYSIYDAIKAGFGKVVFIIKEEFAENFKTVFEPKLNGKIETQYVFQNFDLKQFDIEVEIERAKPWGTGHAILAARHAINEPFCVINADDFYGFDAFKKMVNFLTTEVTDNNFSMIGYEIEKTLSDFGSVSRGVCKVSAEGYLEEITERTNVFRSVDDVVYEENEVQYPLSNNTRVSMNFWGFKPCVFTLAEKLFKEFAITHQTDPKSEFYIPMIVESLLNSGHATFTVVPTDSQWFGVTYKEDKPIVKASIGELIESGVYPNSLWK